MIEDNLDDQHRSLCRVYSRRYSRRILCRSGSNTPFINSHFILRITPAIESYIATIQLYFVVCMNDLIHTMCKINGSDRKRMPRWGTSG